MNDDWYGWDKLEALHLEILEAKYPWVFYLNELQFVLAEISQYEYDNWISWNKHSAWPPELIDVLTIWPQHLA